ncbi:class I SAM-dependent methyltransferase [Salinimonas chungwhensis]|uniref:class I SAM-dependent methyltransferase n=1 Tax=Salinimonas chungwhensis TaxID=265425 RepID=UPI0003747396|nr:class I SAM-dependent methyltransferase [Salinimonas chungwhensis]
MKTTLRVVAASLFALSAQPAMADQLSDAVKSEHRTAAAKVRDEYRNPQQTLRFFGIEPDMTVVEIWPGGGWYTDILSSMLSPDGKLIAAHFHVDEETRDYYKKSLQNFKQQMEDGGKYSGVELTAFHPGKAMEIAEAGSADAVLTFRNVHNWYMNSGQEGVEQAFKTFYKALKPGGVLGVVDHHLPESADDAMMEKSGYVKQSFVVDAAKAAGFTLEAQSDVNANPMDDAQHPKGVWTLPPTLALGEEDQVQYLAIGESNRMTLKFVKPE